MRIQSKTICLWLLAILATGLAFFFFIDRMSLDLRIRKLGGLTNVLGSLAVVPVSIFLTVVEFRRPGRAVGWPLLLFVVSTLPPLLLLVFLLNDPD